MIKLHGFIISGYKYCHLPMFRIVEDFLYNLLISLMSYFY